MTVFDYNFQLFSTLLISTSFYTPINLKTFPIYKQHDAMDCGPTCLRMVAKHYGKNLAPEKLRNLAGLNRTGTSLLGISDAAEQVGFRTIAIQATFDELAKDVQLPAIAYWRQEHFLVVYKIKNNIAFVADPAHGKVTLTKEEFNKSWINNKSSEGEEGIALTLQPTPDFYAEEDEVINKKSFSYLFSYIRPYQKLIFQLILGLLVGSLLQLIFPFLTQSVVDTGIKNKDYNFIIIMLVGQLMLTFSRSIVDFIRSWILLHVGTRINIHLISDFLIKLMRLPISYFDSKMVGDLLQRIEDHKRIEQLLTSNILNTLFSLFNLLIFSVILAIYDRNIFFVFIAGSILYVLYILFFLKKRRELDYKSFGQMSKNQNILIQTLQGMQEIKLFNAEKQKRWEWEKIQAQLLKTNIKSLALTQYQEAGGILINEVKNILITFIAATSVIDGHITLGIMLSIQYILGQLNAPINQLIGFIQTTQNAKLSLERLGEIHEKPNEESDDKEGQIAILPEDLTLDFQNVSFRYGGPESDYVLKDISLSIPDGKVTAIVGSSGSGKTTLIKLLLKFYNSTQGEIKLNGNNLTNYSSSKWRELCGVVMQDGFKFSDTIARNIALGDDYIDKEKLVNAAKIANIYDFIKILPLGFNTKVGNEGIGLSGGQLQRLLIARAVYKNPKIIFFDEATNSLDSENEKIITQNLETFYKGKTVVVVAHRLSTVKNADQIIVLEKGKMVEIGNHYELTAKKGVYYNLVKNQLELGN